MSIPSGKFKLKSNFAPAGDQPQAIKALAEGLKCGAKHQTLLGVTGSGKTFTVANVIAEIQKPTLVIAHNKTLAAQLAAEYREFFPDNAVHYFVSYYDYYQPEAYLPVTDTYIEKEAMINEEIDRLRHASTQALLTRRDVIIVASVSCIYGLGSPAEYEKVNKKIAVGMPIARGEFVRALIAIHFERTTADLSPGQFRALGNMVEVMPVSERVLYRIEIENEVISRIQKIDPTTRVVQEEVQAFFLFPAKHFITEKDEVSAALKSIKSELAEQLKKFEKEGKPLEAERLKRRTSYDLARIREVGYTNGIENYSRHFSGKLAGEPPETLLSYFPHNADGSADFLTVIDESHVTVPQIRGMFAGDRARKDTLVEHGFRLPSARDNRPLQFKEFEERVGQVLYTSATPGPYEFEKSTSHHPASPTRHPSSGRRGGEEEKSLISFLPSPLPKGGLRGVVEQVIRPTGLTDPEVSVRPIVAVSVGVRLPQNLQESDSYRKGGYGGQIADFIQEAEAVIKKGNRAIGTTLTKKMAEDLSTYLKEKGIRTEYLHSDIETLDRIRILTEFRRGKFDVIVGVNLLREGLDLPEVAFIGILDADKEGFLRSETALIQTIGRAARNIAGHVVLYADSVTGSMERAIGETNRRREIQIAYNKKHGITPRTIEKKIHDITEQLQSEHEQAVGTLLQIDRELFKKNPKKVLKEKERQMGEAVKVLDFETAAILRDEIKALKG